MADNTSIFYGKIPMTEHPIPASYSWTDVGNEETMNDEENLKVEINTFVWMHAPKEMTLGAADDMACKIFQMFMEAREKATP